MLESDVRQVVSERERLLISSLRASQGKGLLRIGHHEVEQRERAVKHPVADHRGIRYANNEGDDAMRCQDTCSTLLC